MRGRQLDRCCVAMAASIVVLLGIASAIGMRINDTPSMPEGLYRTTGDIVARGRHVLVCPAYRPILVTALERGYLDAGPCAGTSYMMKRVWAVPGDHIAVHGDGVLVNGMRVPNSAPLAADGAARALPRYRVDDYVLQRGQYLVLSESHPLSFDGRYFGPVERTEIVAVIAPIWIWNGA